MASIYPQNIPAGPKPTITGLFFSFSVPVGTNSYSGSLSRTTTFFLFLLYFFILKPIVYNFLILSLCLASIEYLTIFCSIMSLLLIPASLIAFSKALSTLSSTLILIFDTFINFILHNSFRQ